MKKIFASLLTIFSFFIMNNVFAEDNGYVIYDPTSGENVALGTLGEGSWWDSMVGIKLNILEVQGTEIIKIKSKIVIANEAAESGHMNTNLYINNDIRPKFLQSNSTATYNLSVVFNSKLNDFIKTKHLPTDWYVNGENINLANYLEEDGYNHLKGLLSEDQLGFDIEGIKNLNDYYIIIEPMTRIGELFGTAYDYFRIPSLLDNNKCSDNETDKLYCLKSSVNNMCNDYYATVAQWELEKFNNLKNNNLVEGDEYYNIKKCMTDKNIFSHCYFTFAPTFCYTYSRTVFTKGLFYNTIFLKDSVTVGDSVIKVCYAGENEYNNRKECFNQFNGRGIGIYKLSDIYNLSTLTITKVDDSKLDTKLPNAEFKIYNTKSDCENNNSAFATAKTNNDGVINFGMLKYNTQYYIKETIFPSNYLIGNYKIGNAGTFSATPTTGCIAVTTPSKNSGSSTISVIVTNKEKLPDPSTIKINIYKYDSQKTTPYTTIPIFSSRSEYKLCKGTNYCNTNAQTEFSFENFNASTYNYSAVLSGQYSLWLVTKPINNYEIRTIKYGSNYANVSTTSNLPALLQTFNINHGEEKQINIYLETGCSIALKNMTEEEKTPTNLIALYREYPDYNELLNFTSPKCEANACSSPNINVSCLEATRTNNITPSNLSCFDSTITDAYGNIKAFCQNTFKITNNIGVSKFYGIGGQALIEQTGSSVVYLDENYIKQTVNKNSIVTAQLGKVCYSLYNNITDIDFDLPAVLEVKFGLDSSNNSLTTPVITGGNLNFSGTSTDEIVKYSKVFNYNYSLKNINFNKLDGTVSSSTTEFQKQGLFSKLSSSKSGSIPFTIKYGNLSEITSNSCKFEIKHEIIIPETPGKKIQLEFRVIDTRAPFPNRNPNSNWCVVSGGINSCVSDNELVEEVIINGINSYGYDKHGVKQTPKYKIILGPSDIQNIKDYNKEHPYDELITTVDDNGNVVNKFIYDLKNGVINDRGINRLQTA